MIKTERTTFDLFGGAGYNQQYFSAYSLTNPTPPPPTTGFPSVTQRNATMLFGEELDTKISSRTTFSENFTFYPLIGGSGGYRFTFDTSVSTKIKNWLDGRLRSATTTLATRPSVSRETTYF